MTPGCTTSWKRGPMGPVYVTLSNCHFHFQKMYITQWDIHFPSFKKGLQCGWGGDMTIPSTFTSGQIHTPTSSLSSVRAAES